MGHRGLAGGGLDVLGVHLRAHAEAWEQLAQRHGVGQVDVHAGSRGGGGRHGAQADEVARHAAAQRKLGVDGVLHHKLGHHLPGVARGGVGVVRAVYLGHLAPGDKALGFAGVHKAAHHVDVAVDDVVLRVLVAAVDAFLGEHHSDVGPGYAGYIAVVVDGAAYFILDEVQRLALGAHLFAADGHAADALGCALDEAVHVALPGGANDHDVVGPVVGGHAHAADVVLKPAGGNLGGDNGQGLGIDVVKVVGRRQRHRVLERLRAILIGEGAHFEARGRLAPGPAAAARAVLVQVFDNLAHVNLLVRFQLVAHFDPSLNRATASSTSSPRLSARPASRSGS